jgi:hypothetical protein
VEITASVPDDLDTIPALAAAGVGRLLVPATGMGGLTGRATGIEGVLGWRETIERYAGM